MFQDKLKVKLVLNKPKPQQIHLNTDSNMKSSSEQ